MGGKYLRWTALMLAAVAVGGCCQVASLASLATPDLSVTALLNTAKQTVDALDVATQPDSSGCTVSVTPSRSCPLGREVYFALDYDPATQHAVGLGSGSCGGALTLAVEPTPGHIEFGAVATGDNLLDPNQCLLSFQLEPGAAPRATSSVGDAVETRARNLSLTKNEAGNWELSWDYTNPGDTNQNSAVGMDDLSPLGAFYNRSVSNHWDDPLRNVDCDGNGQIGLSDLTPIGAFYHNDVYAYKIQMSPDGKDGWITVGELLLEDAHASANSAVRFTYTFGAQYVSGAWYRVRPQTHDLALGAPSEAVCETQRMVEAPVAEGAVRQVVVSVQGLPAPMRMMNGCRLIYPANFSYVPESYNIGSPGGERETPDGIWGSFATEVLFPPDSMLVEQDLGNGYKAMDFNVTITKSILDATPVGYGDLFNFQLRNNGGDDDLALSYVDQDIVKRTYFSDKDEQEYFFGNTLALSVK